ncbi:hypothetical protein JCM10207_003849 [Rhodosporidiobolus poonsookiae]
MDESSSSRVAGREESYSLDAVEDEGGVQTTVQDLHRPVSFLSLPDDLIYLVFSYLFDLEFPNDREVATRDDRAPAVLVSKRIFKLCSPLVYQHLHLPDDWARLDDAVGALLDQPAALCLVQRMYTSVPFYSPKLFGGFLRCLPNLTDLTLSNASDQGVLEALPPTLTKVLRTLRHLRYLAILGVYMLEDESFSLDEDIPSLRHFECDDPVFTNLLLNNGARQITSLTLRNLEVEPDETQALPLKRLSLDFNPFASDSGGDKDLINFERFSRMAAMLPNLVYLDLKAVSEISQIPTGFAMPSLRVLVLYGLLNLYDPDVLLNLRKLLLALPSLVTLIAIGFQDRPSKPATVSKLSKLDPADLLVSHPVFAALLQCVKSTSVLEFRFRAIHEKREMRWTRSSSEEDFVSECWTVRERG